MANVPQLKTVYLAETKVTAQGIARLQRSAPKLTIDSRTPHLKAFRLAARPIYDHAILTLAAAPSGGQILAGSGDGRVRIWNLSSRDIINSFPVHDEWAFAVSFHPSGHLLATGGGDNLINLWSWPDMEEVGRFMGHDDDVHAVRFTPDGRHLISASDDWTVRIWDVATRKVLHICNRPALPCLARALGCEGYRGSSQRRTGHGAGGG